MMKLCPNFSFEFWHFGTFKSFLWSFLKFFIQQHLIWENFGYLINIPKVFLPILTNFEGYDGPKLLLKLYYKFLKTMPTRDVRKFGKNIYPFILKFDALSSRGGIVEIFYNLI